jgi:hypothetical protein
MFSLTLVGYGWTQQLADSLGLRWLDHTYVRAYERIASIDGYPA